LAARPAGRRFDPGRNEKWEVSLRSVESVRVGLLVDYSERQETLDPNVLATFQLVAEELLAEGVLDRKVEFVVEAAKGLPEGSFRPVREAFHRLVEQNCVAIFGPLISENGVALREYVEDLAEVTVLTVAGTESMLGEWVFGLPAGSMEEEPVIMAQVAAYDGCRTVGIAYEDSFVGHEYLRSARAACKRVGMRITAEVPIPQIEAEKLEQMKLLALDAPDALMHLGVGIGLLHINEALAEIGWRPRRYTTTAFEFAANSESWRQQLAGWIGLDQYDERNAVGQGFLDRFEARYGRRPAYYFPLLCYDVGRMMLTAVATARPLTGRGVKDAYERIKMMPAATGAPGTRLRFGKFIRHGWVGSEFLVARRVLDDASRSVMHGTIEGLVPPP
jgi:hypothetical protein